MTPKGDTLRAPSRSSGLSGRLPLLFCMVCCLFSLLQAPVLAKTGNSLDQSAGEGMPDWIKPPDFEYSSRGKPDPFQPFIQQTEPEQESQAQDEEPKRPLTPLERVQPSQLSLEGILWNSQKAGQTLALVRLPDGKGYVLKQGTRIGRRQGRVVKITPDRVVIRERVQSIFGEEEQQDVVLELHKSGEENE